jgi:Domain of unknown function (DUF4116)
MLSPSLKHDRDILVAAQASKSLVFSDIPQALTNDTDFWLDVITRDSSFWYTLPEQYKDDPMFVRSIKHFESDELVSAVFTRLPFLSSGRVLWTTVIDSSDCIEYLGVLIEDHASEQISLDKDLMICACKKDASLLEILSSQLQQDRDIIEAVVEVPYEALSYFPESSQRLYPDLLVEAVSKFSKDCRVNIDDYAHNIAEDLWSNLDVIRAWLRAGGSILEDFPETMVNSKEFGLLVAEHCDLTTFVQATSIALRSDKEFMVQAVEKDSLKFLGGECGLDRDFEVAEAAFGGSTNTQSLVDSFLPAVSGSDDFEFLRELLRKTRNDLNAHAGFVKGLLCGMTVKAGAECHLLALVRGVETSLAWKKLIAEYVGVPTGTRLRLLRRVAESLEFIDDYNSDDGTDDDSIDDSDADFDDDFDSNMRAAQILLLRHALNLLDDGN